MKLRKSATIAITTFVLTVASGVTAGQRVFVSSLTTTGDMGGLAGGDARCQQLADDAGLGGLWVAWLSDSSTNARDRINGNGPYVLMDGSQIAADRADLLDGNIDFPIDTDEYGNPPTQSTVATGTLANGYRYNGEYSFCSDWHSSVFDTTPVGLNYATSSGWSFGGGGSCSHPMLLYCFEYYQDPLFSNGFEYGDTSAWSHAVP